MSKPAFTVWNPDHGDEEDGGKVPVLVERWDGGAYDAEDAAKIYREQHHADDEYPDEQTLCVRDMQGVVTTWTVYAERSVTFNAVEQKT